MDHEICTHVTDKAVLQRLEIGHVPLFCDYIAIVFTVATLGL